MWCLYLESRLLHDRPCREGAPSNSPCTKPLGIISSGNWVLYASRTIWKSDRDPHKCVSRGVIVPRTLMRCRARGRGRETGLDGFVLSNFLNFSELLGLTSNTDIHISGSMHPPLMRFTTCSRSATESFAKKKCPRRK